MLKHYLNDESAFSASNNERLVFDFSIRGLWFYKKKKKILGIIYEYEVDLKNYLR